MPKPILLDVPESFESERLLIRVPRAGDGAMLYQAVVESVDRLSPWMPWVHPVPTADEEEELARRGYTKYLSREEFFLILILKGTDTLVGAMGLHDPDWSIPSFEIGYWARTGFEGKGYIGEAVERVTRLAFEILGARRVQIRMDEQNVRSYRVAERAGYHLEGTAINDSRDVAGKLRNTRIYSKTRADE